MADPRIHELKTWPSEFGAVLDGRKRFEFRRNDRDFAVGDHLHLDKWDPAGGAGAYVYPHDTLICEVTYILEGKFGVPEGFCVMGIEFLERACKLAEDES